MESSGYKLHVFVWPVPSQGFEWHRPGASAANVSVGKIEPADRARPSPTEAEGTFLLAQGAEDTERCPFSKADGLFLALAHTSPDPDSVLKFANAYGRLGHRHTSGESLHVWQRQIERLKSAAELRDALIHGDLAIKKKFRWTSQGGAVYPVGKRGDSLDPRQFRVPDARRDDPMATARKMRLS